MKRESHITISIIFIAVILIWGWYQVTPYYCDDFWIGMDWLNGRANWNNYGTFLHWLTTEDSPRLFNFLFPVFLGYIPKWLFNICTGGIWFLSFWLMLKIIGIEGKRPLWTLGLILSIMLCLPWRIDSITCVIYSTNYVWTMPLLFGSIWLFIHPHKTPWPLLSLLGFVSGWAQECIAWPLMGGILCYYLFNRKDTNKPQLAISLGLLAGIIFLTILSYAPRYEGTGALEGLLINPKIILVGLVTVNYLPLIACIVLLMGLCNNRLRYLLWKQRKELLPILVGATIIATIMGSCLWLFGERTTWYAQLLGIMLIAYLINLYIPKPIIKVKAVAVILGVVGVGFLVVHMVAAIIFTYQQAQIWQKIDNEYLKADTGNKYFDIPAPQSIPWLVYNKGSIALEGVREFDWTWRSKFYTGKVMPSPIPMTLKNIDPEELTKVPGNNPFFWYRKHLVVTPTKQRPDKVAVTYSIGMKQEVPTNYTPFTTQNGKDYFYVTLYTPEIMFPWKSIIQVNDL
ncbi:MAG: DUF6056 family protein [Bacteroidales bacterium]|nr:DUF6056 family protein [Bacteroidales bacterium]